MQVWYSACILTDSPPVLFPVEDLYIPTTYVRSTYTSSYFFINEIVAAGQTHSRTAPQCISKQFPSICTTFLFCLVFVRFFRGEKRGIKHARSYPRLTERAGRTMANNLTEEDGKTTLAKGALVTLCCCIPIKEPSEEKRGGKKDWRKYNQTKNQKKIETRGLRLE